jgi:uncharacterized protein YraI
MSGKENAMRFLYSVLSASMLAAALTVAHMPSAHASCVYDVPSWDVLWIRSGPTTRAPKVGSIPSNGCGVRINFDNCRGQWCQVSYRGVIGWAHTRYLRD